MVYEGFSGGPNPKLTLSVSGMLETMEADVIRNYLRNHPFDPCEDYDLIDGVLYDMLISDILGSSENFLSYMRKTRLEIFLS